MALVVKNTHELIDPEKYRAKVLVYGISGVGKTAWAATAPNPGFVACETGHGSGLLTVADKGLDYVEPTNLDDLEAIAKGSVFKDKATIVLDSLSDMERTFIKEAALKIPRMRGDTEKRKKGIPELDDYGVMGEMTYKYLRLLQHSNPDKHIICIATEKYDKADPENGQAESYIGPNLPGQMFHGAPAAFDLVLRLRVRPALKTPGDAKSRYIQRYFITQPDSQGSIVKGRPSIDCKPLIPAEVVFDPSTGEGCFNYFLQKICDGYAAALKK